MAESLLQPFLAPEESPALGELTDALEGFWDRTRQSGCVYAREGHVGSPKRDAGVLTAQVRGKKRYVTSWSRTTRGWNPDCTCSVGPLCKHAYALACVLLSQARADGTFDDPRLRRLIPSEAILEKNTGTSGLAAEPAAGAVARKDSPLLEQLRTARRSWQRESALDGLLAGCPVQTLNPYTPPLVDVLEEPDPDVLCWRLAREIYALSDGWLPPELVPYRDRSDIEEQYAEQAGANIAEELQAWGEQRRRVPPRTLRLVFRLDRDDSDQEGLSCELRASSARLDDEPRNPVQLQQLRSEFRRSPASLSADEGALLEWFADHCLPAPGTYGEAVPRYISSSFTALLERVSDSPLACWSESLPPDLAARAGIRPGGPVRFRSHPARLLPALDSRNGSPWIVLRFVWPDKTERSQEEVVFLPGASAWGVDTRSIVLSDGQISVLVEEPPSGLMEGFVDLGGVAVPRAQRTPVLSSLVAGFPHLQDSLQRHTRLFPTRPIIAMDVGESDWLQARLFAVTGTDRWIPGTAAEEGVDVFEYTGGLGWVRRNGAGEQSAIVYAPVEAAPSEDAPGEGEPADTKTTVAVGAAIAEGEIWLEAPDPECVDPTVAWMHSLPFQTRVRKGAAGAPAAAAAPAAGWWMRLNTRRLELLGEAWDRRPIEALFFGTERVRRLLASSRTARPRVRITASGVDWFTVSADWQREGGRLSEKDLAKLRTASTRFVKLASGWVQRELAAEQDETSAMMADLGLDPEDGEQRVTVWQLAGASPENLLRLESLGVDAETVTAVRQLRERVDAFAGVPEIPVPSTVKGDLRPYQRRALDFLVYASKLGLGAVLADDMGLGKTLQALAWLAWLRQEDPEGGPCLVVCPASVVHNWEREAARFTPELSVLMLARGSGRHTLRSQISNHDLVVTNYSLLRRDIEAWQTVDLRAAILDEAQFIKNPDAAVTRAAGSLRARHRLALTGTPLENRALDLWSIVHFVNPGYLGPRRRFQANFDQADAPSHVNALLSAKLRPVLLRRTKKQVAPELPERIEERYDCELTRDQRLLYMAELRESRSIVERAHEGKGGVGRNQISVLAALTRLRQVCCHPALVGGSEEIGSGKFDALFELLEPLLAEGHKVLLFSQFVRCLNLIAEHMRVRGVRHHILTGQTRKRHEVVDAFQGDPDASVFLISLKAGGTGLNLTSASYVILFDPWWNPAVEAQAIDRTHRIGQDRTVIAYRMLTRGTVEEKIWELQQRKASMARDILDEGVFARSLTRDDLDFLLTDT